MSTTLPETVVTAEPLAASAAPATAALAQAHRGDAGLRVPCHGVIGAWEAVKPVPPTGYAGLVDVATIMAGLAKLANFTFHNAGVTDKFLIDPYLPGTAVAQYPGGRRARGHQLRHRRHRAEEDVDDLAEGQLARRRDPVDLPRHRNDRLPHSLIPGCTADQPSQLIGGTSQTRMRLLFLVVDADAVAGPSHIDLCDQRSVVRCGPHGGGRVAAADPVGCRHRAAVGGGGGLAHGAAVALSGGDGSALRDSATGNGRDLNVVQLNQISHLVDSLDRLRTGIDRTQRVSPQETVASVQSGDASSISGARFLTRRDVMSREN